MEISSAPSGLPFLITTARISQLVEEKLVDTDQFVVDIHVRPGNKIEVILDCDSGLTIQMCRDVHRHIEGAFDREVEDFELQVSSPGVGQPLKVRRQYFKNVGRTLSVKTTEGGKVEGPLLRADEKGIVLHTAAKEEVPGKKGKKLVEREVEIPFDQITETKIVVQFK
jgi:ribosome maturation factor RimP